MSTGLLVSSFDLFNVADLDLIAQARTLCDRLVVGVMTDDDVLTATGQPPVVPLHGRLALLGHVRGVDEVAVADSRLQRWGADDRNQVFTSPEAETVRRGDAVMIPSRRSASRLMGELARRDRAKVTVGAAL